MDLRINRVQINRARPVQGHQVPSVRTAAGLALVFLLMYYFLDSKNSHKQFMSMYFNILAFVISPSNFNIFLFEQ